MSALEPHVHVRCDAGRPNSGENAEWMLLIWKTNEVFKRENPDADDCRIFGRPDHLGKWWAGGSVEEYPDARVIHRDDGTVSVCGKTALGDEFISKAADEMGIHHVPTISYHRVES